MSEPSFRAENMDEMSPHLSRAAQDADGFRILKAAGKDAPMQAGAGVRKSEFCTTERLCLAVGIAALTLMAGMIALSPARLFHDEPDHMRLVKLVDELGWRAGSASPANNCATGPLFYAAQLAAAPLTSLQAPSVRWVNYFFLLIVIITLARTARSDSAKNSWLTGLSVLSVPFLWPTAGLTLTELSALAAFSVFVFAMRQMIRPPGQPASMPPLAWACLAGVSLGIAVLGRQTYLAALPAVAAMFVLAPKKWPAWLLCLTLSAVTCGWLFIYWRGLVPSNLGTIDGGIRLDHGILALSYVAAATFFLRPEWVYPKNRLTLAVAMALGISLTFAIRDYANPPCKSLLLKICGEPLGLFIGFAIGMLMIVAGVIWLWNTLQMAWAGRSNPWRTFLFLTLFALLASPMKISDLFCSRYVVGLLGVLVLSFEPAQVSGKSLLARLMLGAAIGAASLWMYYV